MNDNELNAWITVVAENIDTNRKTMTEFLDADVLTVPEICDKFNVSEDKVKSELTMGIKVEYEHSSDDVVAERIALAHLSELPDYYTRLKKMEKDGKYKWNEK